jgi:hypothetical protein
MWRKMEEEEGKKRSKRMKWEMKERYGQAEKGKLTRGAKENK